MTFKIFLQDDSEMARSFEEILGGLNELQPLDFDMMRPESNGIERLNSLTDELMSLPNPERAIPALFEVMERMSEVDLGSPGPVAHTLERLRGYERHLIESLNKKPTPLTVWMVNRILNATDEFEVRRLYLDSLRVVTKHPAVSEEAKRQALQFLSYQSKKH